MDSRTPIQERDNAFGHFVRRHFEPLMLAAQVLIDLGVVLLACLVGFLIGQRSGGPGAGVPLSVYIELWTLTAAVCLVCFHAFGMYSPVKSLLNVEEFKAIAKSCAVAFLVVVTLTLLLRSTEPTAAGVASTADGDAVFRALRQLHAAIDLRLDPTSFSRLTLLVSFVLILFFTTVSRFVSFKTIQSLHRRGIGNRNALVLGTGTTAQWLMRKFTLVPTLGLRTVGFVGDDPDEVGRSMERSVVLGTFDELEALIGRFKVSEVFVALPEAAEERVMEFIERLEALGVTYRVVPRFYHLMSQRVRIENLDSIPLISRPDRSQGTLSALVKRLLDIALALVTLVLTAPLFVVAAILIKRDSEGPIFYLQERIGKDGRPFRIFKFRTMHVHLSGDAPAPRDDHDPRITTVGRLLRRYSLDELPQVLNVLTGEMSMVGPRPEMPFIVAGYGALERERLRAKPGITGLWQISYARTEEIHKNLDYDIYYVENRSLLLDLVILVLTVFAVVKGTGAH
ncbi:sugar transferase [Engelhardtia mirabilis]|uniref:UDP-glucose:undecaprenyl-phosphate glucose-1-phosphate transferase n=1 Tax=Engelhardtia mirabilis TaxID=2528011 RepID=A0A518BK72_9BACT|nr:UDP-glucose:undecaprenyl-phosphate glucose-1-phosphate transferase [Planctomycetes bacterium Pla133]QDV01697.1 UDP-glucose:undecaprenyl-phosphate glucose-1-phosphate transferase [Planctomycetes bacterium Pla86]